MLCDLAIKDYPAHPKDYLSSDRCHKAREALNDYASGEGRVVDADTESLFLLKRAVAGMEQSKEGLQLGMNTVFALLTAIIGLLTLVVTLGGGFQASTLTMLLYLIVLSGMFAVVGVITILNTQKLSARMADYRAYIEVLERKKAPAPGAGGPKP